MRSINAEGEILRVAAARRESHVDGAENAVLAEAGMVVDPHVVTFARHDHVVVAVEAHLARPAGLVGAECGERRPLRRLALLAAEAAAHAAHLAR